MSIDFRAEARELVERSGVLWTFRRTTPPWRRQIGGVRMTSEEILDRAPLRGPLSGNEPIMLAHALRFMCASAHRGADPRVSRPTAGKTVHLERALGAISDHIGVRANNAPLRHAMNALEAIREWDRPTVHLDTTLRRLWALNLRAIRPVDLVEVMLAGRELRTARIHDLIRFVPVEDPDRAKRG